MKPLGAILANIIFEPVRQPLPVANRPNYDDGASAAMYRAYLRATAKAERSKLRFVILDAMRRLAERGEPYLIDGSMALSDQLWRTYAELIVESAAFESVAPCGSSQLLITKRGLAILDQIIDGEIV